MIKLFITFIIIVSSNSMAITLRTVSQDNSKIKYNAHSDDSFKLPGFCREVANFVSQKIKNLQIIGFEKEVPIQRIEQFLERDQIDIFFCLLKTKEREQKFNYIDIPLYEVSNSVLIKADDPLSKKNDLNFEDFKAQGVVLVNRGSALVNQLKKMGIKYNDGGKDDWQILNLLDSGRGRFFYGQDVTLKYMLQNHPDKKKYKILRMKESSNAQYVVYSKKLDKNVVLEIEEAIAGIKRDGSLDKLYKKYSLKMLAATILSYLVR